MKTLQTVFWSYCLVLTLTITTDALYAQTDAPLQAFDWKVGDSWSFDYVINGKVATETWTVTQILGDEVTTSPAKKTFIHDAIFTRDGQLLASMSPYTKERITYGAYRSLHFPLMAGEKWASDVTLAGETFTADGQFQWRAIGWEKVRVPAGEFNAMKVEMTSAFKGSTNQGISFSGTGKETRWYAYDVRSWVKWETSDSLGRSFNMVLTKFVPGN
jgi:hypothetical protein